MALRNKLYQATLVSRIGSLLVLVFSWDLSIITKYIEYHETYPLSPQIRKFRFMYLTAFACNFLRKSNSEDK